MDIQEASERYEIPPDILSEYEGWRLNGSVDDKVDVRRYDDDDLERLSLLMTLHDIGFSGEEAKMYMCFAAEGEAADRKRLHMLNGKRKQTLEEIHIKERQIDRLDYLRYKIQKEQQSATRKRKEEEK